MKSLRYLNKYFVKYKWRFLLGILFIFGNNFFKVMLPNFVGDATRALKEWQGAENPDDLFWYAFKTGGYYMLIALIAGVFLFLTRQSIIIMSRYIEYDLKNEVYQQYQRLGYTFYRKNSTGDLMNRISEDITKVRMYLGPGVMYTINLAILAILVVYNMVQINGFMTIIVLIPLPLMSLMIYTVASKINKVSSVVQKEQSLMSTLVQETFSGIRVVKAYHRQNEVNEKFDNSADAYKQKNMRLVMINSLFMPTVFLLVGISTIMCIYIGGTLAIESQNTAMDVPSVITFIIYVNMLTWPFASVGWVISLTQRAAASQERINEFLKEAPEIVNRSSSPFDFKDRIVFKNVTYTYPNSGITAIKDLSFTLKKGETLGVIGRTGSGKSTIIRLLLREIEPTNGTIFVDGQPLSDINLESLRNTTGIVPQDVFLFSDSIRNNITFGANHDDISEEELVEVTQKAHVYHNIKAFNDGFDTILGERGVNLSGGQKQRVSIARALIRKPSILILDDCLSAVDTETEEIILKNFNQMDVTSLIVSHRVSSIRNATHILNLEEGALAEEGTHEELLKLNSLYAELYHKQLAEEEDSD